MDHIHKRDKSTIEWDLFKENDETSLTGVTSDVDVRNIIFDRTDQVRLFKCIYKSVLGFINQMTSVSGKENLKCFNIMN